MTGKIPEGSWVEIHQVVLPAGQRASQVPEDTQGVDLEMLAKGFLVATSGLGEEVEIQTPAGRRLRGALVRVNPPYSHGFGPPIPELSVIGGEVRAMLRTGRRQG
jgi:hypothetical protein